jgi:hypothetical protein
VCGTKKSNKNASYCSKSCKAKHFNLPKEKTSGYTKEYIEQLIWSEPYTIAAIAVGLSDNGLKKMAIRLGCIMPPPRFHVKSQTDKELIKDALIPQWRTWQINAGVVK